MPAVRRALTASDMLSDGTSTEETGCLVPQSKREEALCPGRASYSWRQHALVAAAICDRGARTFLGGQGVTKAAAAIYRGALS